MVRRTAEQAHETRAAVLDAALTVFAERGYGSAQLEEIAAGAGVTRGALYHHFADKADLFLSVLRERWHSVMQPVLAELQGARDPTLRLRAFVTAFVHALDSQPQARALLRMSLSGDVKLPEFAPYLKEKLDTFEAWQSAIAAALSQAGAGAEARVRAQALLASLIGYCVWSSLGRGAAAHAPSTARQMPEAERRLLVACLLHGAL